MVLESSFKGYKGLIYLLIPGILPLSYKFSEFLRTSKPPLILLM